MQADFWQARWTSNEIGFHLNQVNPWLVKFWPNLDLPASSKVLVPLCGKSLDLCWLRERGHQVLGVELSRKAVEAFFSEQELAHTIEEQGGFSRYRATDLELWCGDFFALRASDVADCLAVYDRAALIALPGEMRERYAAHLDSILPAACSGLLLTLEYPQQQMDGPPFAVLEDEVRERFGACWQIELLQRADVLQENARFAERGVLSLHEVVYRLQKHRE